MGFQPALCSVTFRALPVERVIALAVEARLSGIEWGGDVHVPSGDIATARRVRRLTEDAGLVATSYGSYVAPPADDLAGFEAALETTLALGAPHIRVWAGTRQRPSADYSAGEREEAARAIDAMAARAEAAGVTLGLEYHPDSLTDTTDSAMRLMAGLASKNVYLYWQPRPGLALDAALAEIAEVGPHVCHLHVFAWNELRERFALKTQAEAWRAMAGALQPGRWDGPRYAMLEFVAADAPERFLEDAAVLADILGERPEGLSPVDRP